MVVIYPADMVFTGLSSTKFVHPETCFRSSFTPAGFWMAPVRWWSAVLTVRGFAFRWFVCQWLGTGPFSCVRNASYDFLNQMICVLASGLRGCFFCPAIPTSIMYPPLPESHTEGVKTRGPRLHCMSKSTDACTFVRENLQRPSCHSASYGPAIDFTCS